MTDERTPVCGRDAVAPDARILICLGPCHGEFYYPLTADEPITCPYDRTHPVAVYQSPTIHKGREDI